MKYRKIVLLLALTILNLNATEIMPIVDKSMAFYGDFSSSDVHVINIDKMKLEQTLEGGIGAYGQEPVGHKYIVSLTRKDTSIDIIDVENRDKRIVSSVFLGYQPREVATNSSQRYSVVSGRDIPAHTVFNVKTGRVIKHFNRNQTPVKLTDFGGQNATGHPIFVSEYEYLILDRVHREIRLYHVFWGLKDVLKTETSTHHVLRKGNKFYVVMEGSGSSSRVVSPAILKLSISSSRHKIRLEAVAYLENRPTKSLGIHHMNFHYDGRHIYTGSNNGLVYVVDSKTMRVVDKFESGEGGGHIDFSPKYKKAMVTNHKSTFITMVDVSNPRRNRVIKDIEVADYAEGVALQGHTQIMTDDENHFIGAATHDSHLFEVSMRNGKITRTLELDGAVLEQGFMYQSPEGEYANPKPRYSNNTLRISSVKTFRNLNLNLSGNRNRNSFGRFSHHNIFRENRHRNDFGRFSHHNVFREDGWDIAIRHDGYINFVHRQSNRCLSVKQGLVVTEVCDNQKDSQLWKINLVRTASFGLFHFNLFNSRSQTNIKHYGGKCLSSDRGVSLKECRHFDYSERWKLKNLNRPFSYFNVNRF